MRREGWARSRAGGARAGRGFGLPRESWGGGDRGGSGWARPDRQGDSGPSTVPRGTRTYAKPWEEDEALGGESRPPKWGKGPTTVPSARPHFLPSAGPGCHREDRRFRWTFPSRGLEVRGDRFQEGQ